MSIAGIVVAAGRAERFGAGVPKQFERIGGVPVVERAVLSLTRCPAIGPVVVVLPAETLGGQHAAALRAIAGVHGVVAGGATRAESVRRGLEPVRDHPFVLVHDAARPLAGPAVIEAVIRGMLEHGAAVPVVPVTDTVRKIDGAGFSAGTVDRDPLRLAQTPQGVRTAWLIEALEAAVRDGVVVTDEGGALERLGRPVLLVAGDPDNVKITTPGDLARVEAKLAGAQATPRVGTGFDIHRFGGLRPLVLGGVTFPGELGLLGHSDADVLLHAAMDAVLGAAALPDIGHHFPPEDPTWAGAASTDLVRRVVALVAQAGFTVSNLDLTLLAERPRIGPRVADMRAATAACFGVGVDRIGIKATTLETLGALGRGEGIAGQAIALLVPRAGGSS